MHNDLVEKLEMILEDELPGSLAHQKMLPKGRTLKETFNGSSSIKKSGVLFLLFPDNNKIFTCLIKRPFSMTHHPGQIGFPGGKVEEIDGTARIAACREAREEIGIDTDKIKILGQLSDLYVSVSGFSIQPVIAWSDYKPEFVINKDEVERLILFPISDYTHNDSIVEKSVMTISGEVNVPCFQLNGDVIWGATAMIISEFIEIINKQKINFQEHFYNPDKY